MSKLTRLKKCQKSPMNIMSLFQQTWHFLSNILKKNIEYLKINQFINYLNVNSKPKWALLWMFILVVIFLAGIFPSKNNFEGSLVVKKISFTYNGQEPNKLLINNINGIKRLLSNGRQTLILTGKFSISSSSNPELNQKLPQQNITLKIELPNEDSQWMITPANSQLKSQLKLTELRLRPQTTVDSLSYNPDNHRLAFSLLPTGAIGKQEKSNFILDLGQERLQITLKRYQLIGLDLPKNSNSDNSIQLNFQPSNPEVRLSINTKTRLSIDLPLSDPSKVNYEEWLRGDFAVKDMQFNELDRTGINLDDDLEKSTIIKGDIRMREQELKIESNQFLMTGKPGIQRLRYLAIIPPKKTAEVELRINGESVEISEPTEGIEARIAGRAKRLQVGIDPRLPVKNIQSNYLASWGLPNDLIISIIPFLLGVIVSLFTWLIDDFLSSLKSNSTSSPNT